MATTPQEFFSKNMKWILLVVSVLFFVKTFQSCNRNTTIGRLNEEIIHLQDSLSSTYGIEKETLLLRLRECEYEVKLAESRRDEANKRADAVQSTAEKTRSNTTSTIVVKGVEQVVDSTKVKK